VIDCFDFRALFAISPLVFLDLGHCGHSGGEKMRFVRGTLFLGQARVLSPIAKYAVSNRFRDA
jgi:hypothetical protein